MANLDLTQSELKSLLSYDETNGKFYWLVKTGHVKAGQLAGTPNMNGYVRIIIRRKKYYAHRLAWLYVNGNFPEHQIDHINGCRSDNKIVNLRLATQKQNSENVSVPSRAKSKVRGVTWCSGKSLWRAQVRHNYKTAFFGYFNNVDDAEKAVIQGRRSLFTHSLEKEKS